MTWDYVLMVLAGEAGILTLALGAYVAVRLVLCAMDRRDLGARLTELEGTVAILETRYARLSRGRRGVEVHGETAAPASPDPSLQGQAAPTREDRRRMLFAQLRAGNGR